MTDEQLATFVGIADLPAETRARFIAGLSLEKRALFERMSRLEVEVELWQQGLGPKPVGVMICGCGRKGRHHHRRRR